MIFFRWYSMDDVFLQILLNQSFSRISDSLQRFMNINRNFLRKTSLLSKSIFPIHSARCLIRVMDGLQNGDLGDMVVRYIRLILNEKSSKSPIIFINSILSRRVSMIRMISSYFPSIRRCERCLDILCVGNFGTRRMTETML